MSTKFAPLHDRIVVRRIEEAGTTRGGLIIPDSAKDKPQEGEVISIGKGKTNDEGKVFPLSLKEGDRIIFGKYSGTEIEIDGEEVLIMKRKTSSVSWPARRKKRPQEREGSCWSFSRNCELRPEINRNCHKEIKNYGKANRTRRTITAGNPTRRQPLSGCHPR